MLTCLPSLMKMYSTVKSLWGSKGYFHICLSQPWPLTPTSKIYRGHLHITIKMSVNSDEDAHNGLVSVECADQVISIYIHCDLNFWPSKSIGFIFSSWLNPNIRKRVFASPVQRRIINYRAIYTPIKGVKDLAAREKIYVFAFYTSWSGFKMSAKFDGDAQTNNI